MTERAPDGLGERGRLFWEGTLAAFELEGGEVALLTETCRTLDLCDALQATVMAEGPLSTGSQGQVVAHPAVTELRAHRLVLARLLGQLALPDEEGGAMPTGRQLRGRQAAARRWSGHAKVGDRGPA
jgi:hypothetical protein